MQGNEPSKLLSGFTVFKYALLFLEKACDSLYKAAQLFEELAELYPEYREEVSINLEKLNAATDIFRETNDINGIGAKSLDTILTFFEQHMEEINKETEELFQLEQMMAFPEEQFSRA